MITLYGFSRIFPAGIGKTRDLRAEWALEELGLPYRVHGLDQTAGDLASPEFSKISPFRQAPVIDDDGFTLSESPAILLYLAEKAGKLIPADFQGRSHVVQWCFAAVSTVEPTLVQIQLIDAGIYGDHGRRAQLVELAARWLDGLVRRLDGREWIAGDDFTVADILLASILRGVRKTRVLESYPSLITYLERALARPAWQRTLAAYAERFGVAVADIA